MGGSWFMGGAAPVTGREMTPTTVTGVQSEPSFPYEVKRRSDFQDKSFDNPGRFVLSPVDVPFWVERKNERKVFYTVHRKRFQDAEQFNLVLPETTAEQHGFMSGVTTCNFHRQDGDVLRPQQVYRREAGYNWVLFSQTAPDFETMTRLEFRNNIKTAAILRGVIEETLQNPGAHDEHLVALAESELPVFDNLHMMKPDFSNVCARLIRNLRMAVWEKIGKYYPWFMNSTLTKLTMPEAMLTAKEEYDRRVPSRIAELPVNISQNILLYDADGQIQYKGDF